MQFLWCLAICFWEIGSSDAEIRQPWSLVLEVGKPAWLECSQTFKHNSMMWYQQKAGQGLQLLYNFYNRQQQEKGNVPDRFAADQPQTERCNLNISSVEREDSAVYYCASSLDTALQNNPFLRQKHVVREVEMRVRLHVPNQASHLLYFFCTVLLEGENQWGAPRLKYPFMSSSPQIETFSNSVMMSLA